MLPKFTLGPFRFASFPTRLRFPFRYGIASMTEVPHLFVQADVQCENASSVGLASEGLPPKWFTKDPATPVEADLRDMREVIEHAATAAVAIASAPITYFDWWRELNRQQTPWSALRGFPPLLAHLGVSLCERAVLDALCRSFGMPLHELVRRQMLGLELGDIYEELKGCTSTDLLPPAPLRRVILRHTIGLTDPITPADIPAGEKVEDGLPQDLESSIAAYGLRYFKIKLSGRHAHDTARLNQIVRVLNASAPDWFATLDGNENFNTFAAFREFWQSLVSQPVLRSLGERLIVVEQPVHRAHALSDEAGSVLRNWRERPPLIIDESDGALGNVSRALELGYVGTSHKNCKGIVKGIANACLLAHRRRRGAPGVLTGEDLCNLGPVALLQDLAMMALLGIQHAERNGHHYYRGLSLWPRAWQEEMLQQHDDLYARHPDGFAALRVERGEIAVGSINAAPFGCGPLLDPSTLPATASQEGCLAAGH